VKPIAIEQVISEVQRLLEVFKDRRPEAIARPSNIATPDGRSVPASPRGARRSRSKAFVRFVTTSPPVIPPPVSCPSCDRPLAYERSYIGGVTERQQEQWDQYTCAKCGRFQYRHRTRKLSRTPQVEGT